MVDSTEEMHSSGLIDAHIRVCLSAAYPIWTLRAYRRFLFSGTSLVHVIGLFRPEQSSTSAPRCFKRGHGKVGKAVNGRPCEATRFIGQVGQVGRYIPAVYSTKRTFTAGFLKMLSKPAEKCGWAVRPSQGHTLPPQPNEDPVPNVLLLPDFAGSRPTAVAYISI